MTPTKIMHAHTLALLAGLLTLGTASAATMTYDYDPNGNVLVRQTPTQTDTAGFDALDRQTLDASGDGLLRQFEYDANGNRTRYQVDTQSETLTYTPTTNRLSTRGAQPITLDPQGRITDDGQYQYVYDTAGRLRQAMQGATEIARYHYNPQGQRTRKTTAQGTTLYHYDLQGQLLLETTSTGQSIKRYLWRDTQPLAQIDRHPTSGVETIVYLHTDHQYTPRTATNAQGVVVWRWPSEAFGSLLAYEDADGDGTLTVINLRFPGQYADAESGLIYNWNRYYDPRTGRYITSDPIGLAGGLNTYAYVANNPLRWTDPLGLKTLQCTKPLNALTDKFGSAFSKAAHDYVPAAYHQYSCVIDKNGKVTCGGQDHSGSTLRSPGKPSEDKPEAGQCKEVEPDDACFEKCLIDEWAKPRPTYGIPFGTDCQEYDDDVIQRCRKQCKK